MRTLMLSSPFQQRGLSFMVVLIALVSLALAAVALIRTVDTGTLLMGSLGFKHGATSAADDAVAVADTWLIDKINNAPTDLYDSVCSTGCKIADARYAYYATSLDALDIAGHMSSSNTRILIDWDDDGCAYAAAGSFSACLKASVKLSASDSAYSTRYVITRLCKTTGDPAGAGNNCAIPVGGAQQDAQINKGEIKYGNLTALKVPGSGGGTSGMLSYRVIVRALGPRHSVSYTETYFGSFPT